MKRETPGCVRLSLASASYGRRLLASILTYCGAYAKTAPEPIDP